MKRKRDEGGSGGGPTKRAKSTYRSSYQTVQPMQKGRKGYRTVARTRGPFSGGEMKYSDSFKTMTAVAESTNWTATELDPGTANCLFSPVQGNDINNREGRKVHVYKIKIRGLIQRVTDTTQTAVSDDPAVRVMLVQDCQTNGVQMQGEELMQTSEASTAITFTGFQNLANLGRFKVLKDKTYYPVANVAANNASATTISQASGNIPFKMTVVFKEPVMVRFNATDGGTVADIIDNSWHIIAQRSGTSGSCLLGYTCRVCFKE